MFKSLASLVKFKPQDGMKVIVTGQVSVYERDGTYQLYCRTMKQEGLGDLYAAYEHLKKKLEKEGLFDENIKKPIPYLPNRVGVITSQTGAVIKDIINVSTRRYNKVNLLIYPAAVQGVNVASTVIKGIEVFNELNNVDVIIIARGGGSFEDLFGFNDERLARKIFESKIPIISAVGHETEFTICDFVSDLRAPTPSAAAELVYPEYSDIISRINMCNNRNLHAIKSYIERRKQYVKAIKSARIDKVPLNMINNYRMEIDRIVQRGYNSLNLQIEKKKAELVKTITKIDTMSPLKTLTRGYSIVQSGDKVIKSKKQVKSKDELKVILNDGKIDVVVK